MLRPTRAPDTPQRRHMSCGIKLGVNSITTTAFIALLQAVKDRNENLQAEPAKYLNKLLADFLRCGYGRLGIVGRNSRIPQEQESDRSIASERDEFYKKYQEKLSRGLLVYRKKVSWSQICMSRLRASAIAMAQREKTTTTIDSNH